MTTQLNTFDLWAFNGYAGLNNMISERFMEYPLVKEIPFSVLIEEHEKLGKIIEENKDKVIKESSQEDCKVTLRIVDSWILRGLTGLLNRIEKRIQDNEEQFCFRQRTLIENQLKRISVLMKGKITMQEETVRKWMQANKESYLKECEGPNDTISYLVMDANFECDTQLDESTLEKLAKEVLGL